MATQFVPAPPAAITRILSSFTRQQLAGFVAVAIDLIDITEGDPDSEANGDEADGSPAEDDWHHASRPGGLSYVPPSNCEDAEDDDPPECNGDLEREDGSVSNYAIDQRIAAVGHGYAPWHIDRDEPATC